MRLTLCWLRLSHANNISTEYKYRPGSVRKELRGINAEFFGLEGGKLWNFPAIGKFRFVAAGVRAPWSLLWIPRGQRQSKNHLLVPACAASTPSTCCSPVHCPVSAPTSQSFSPIKIGPSKVLA